MERYLGIDIGGNHIKTGFVDSLGIITDFQSYKTSEIRETGNFPERFSDIIAFRLAANPEVRKVGIGLPGMISANRKVPIVIPSIPELNGFALHSNLKSRFPEMDFVLENDANAAALGEFMFGKSPLPDSFAFVTLGTGIGSAMILDGKIFKGADGNGLELGHILSRDNRKLETNIGKQGIINLAELRLKSYGDQTVIPKNQPVSATHLVVSASEGDAFSNVVLFEVGEILGEGLVALIRILDVKTIVFGGGLSAGFEFIRPGILNVLNSWLPTYYTNSLDLRLATLGNDAGVLGAAALCF